MNKNKILKRLKSLPKDHLSKEFKKIESVRNDRNKKFIDETTEDLLLLLNEIEERLAVFQARYGTENATDLNRPLNAREIRLLKTNLNKYKKRAKDNGISFDKDVESRLNNINGISRIKGLKLEVTALLHLTFGLKENEIRELLEDEYIETALLTAYYMFKSVGYQKDLKDLDWNNFDERQFESWRADGASFDEQLWRNKRWASADIEKIIEYGLHQARTHSEINTDIEKVLKRQRNKLEGDLTSDSTLIGVWAVADMLGYLGTDYVVYTAIVDNRTSEMCLDANGNIIPIDEIDPGENAPPLHTYCRSYLEPYLKEGMDKFFDGVTDDDIMEDLEYQEWYVKHFRGKK